MKTIKQINANQESFLKRIFYLLLFLFLTGSSFCWSNESIKLQWDANYETSLTGYKVYYKTDFSGYGILNLYDGQGLFYNDRAVDSGFTIYRNQLLMSDPVLCNLQFTDEAEGDVEYFFVVTAFNSAGESDPSNEVSVFVHNDDMIPINQNCAVYDSDTGVISIPAFQFAGSCFEIVLNPFEISSDASLYYREDYYILDLKDMNPVNSCGLYEEESCTFDGSFNIYIPELMMDGRIYEVTLFIDFNPSVYSRVFWILDRDTMMIKD